MSPSMRKEALSHTSACALFVFSARARTIHHSGLACFMKPLRLWRCVLHKVCAMYAEQH
jgi:hypothetical protein